MRQPMGWAALLLLGLWSLAAEARILLEDVRFRPERVTPGERVRVAVTLRNTGERRAPALRVLFVRAGEAGGDVAFAVNFRGRARPRPGEAITRSKRVPAREVRTPGRRCYQALVVPRRGGEGGLPLARASACFTVTGGAGAGEGAMDTPPEDPGAAPGEEADGALLPVVRSAVATRLVGAGAYGFELTVAHPEARWGPPTRTTPAGRLELWLMDEGRRLGEVDLPELRPGEMRRVGATLWAPIPWGRCAHLFFEDQVDQLARLCVGQPELRVVAWIDQYRVLENGVAAAQARTRVRFVLWCGAWRDCPGSDWSGTTLTVADGDSGTRLPATVWRQIRAGDRPSFQLMWQVTSAPAGAPAGAGSGRWNANVPYRVLLSAAQRGRPYRLKGGVFDQACRRDPDSYRHCLRVALVAAFDPTPVGVEVVVRQGGTPTRRPGP